MTDSHTTPGATINPNCATNAGSTERVLFGKSRWSSQFEKGTVLANKYTIVRCLGSGAAGIVFHATQHSNAALNVAIKICPTAFLQQMGTNEPPMLKHIAQEMQGLNTLDSPHITKFYECLRDQDYVAIVMEFVEGQTLSDYIEQRTKVDWRQSFQILLQLLRGTQAMHKAHYVHRDLKPSNVLLSRENVVKITDLGLCRKLKEHPLTLYPGGGFDLSKTNHNVTEGIVGTPAYMSVEYICDGIVSYQLDIYSLGVIAYELLTDRDPFGETRHTSIQGLLCAKVMDTPTLVHEVNPECPAELSRIVHKALETEPQDRLKSATEFYQQLMTFSSHFESQGGLLTPSYSSALETTADLIAARSWRERLGQYLRKSISRPNNVTVLVGFVMLIAAAGLLLSLVSPNSRSRIETTTVASHAERSPHRFEQSALLSAVSPPKLALRTDHIDLSKPYEQITPTPKQPYLHKDDANDPESLNTPDLPSLNTEPPSRRLLHLGLSDIPSTRLPSVADKLQVLVQVQWIDSCHGVDGYFIKRDVLRSPQKKVYISLEASSDNLDIPVLAQQHIPLSRFFEDFTTTLFVRRSPDTRTAGLYLCSTTTPSIGCRNLQAPSLKALKVTDYVRKPQQYYLSDKVYYAAPFILVAETLTQPRRANKHYTDDEFQTVLEYAIDAPLSSLESYKYIHRIGEDLQVKEPTMMGNIITLTMSRRWASNCS